MSGIAVDPGNPNHAFISFSGYNAYATASATATGHVFEVTYNPTTHTATWTNLDYNLGDQPITDIAFDSNTGDLFVSTDFGVNMLRPGDTQWVPAAGSLPPVAVYGLTIDSNAQGSLRRDPRPRRLEARPQVGVQREGGRLGSPSRAFQRPLRSTRQSYGGTRCRAHFPASRWLCVMTEHPAW